MTPKTQRGNGSGSRSNERPLTDIAQGALKAKSCRCQTPWIEVDPDGTFHCVGCGRDWERTGWGR